MHEGYMKYLFVKIRIKMSFIAFMRQETLTELWLKQILKTLNYIRDSGQVFYEARTRDEEKVVSKIMEGNIKYCLEIIQKAQAKKLKHTAGVDLAHFPPSSGDEEDEGSSDGGPFSKKKSKKGKSRSNNCHHPMSDALS